mgnify:CR=1 FL=1
MKKFTTKTIKLPKDVDEKYSQMNYLKEISKNIGDIKDGEKDDFVMFGHIEPLYLKNCIKHFESLPENITNFIIKNYDVNKFNLIGQILQTKHPIIFQTFNQVMNGNIISLGCEFALHKKLFEEYYNWHVSVIADLMSGIPADVLMTKEEMTIINDILFTTYWMTYGNFNKGSIFVV